MFYLGRRGVCCCWLLLVAATLLARVAAEEPSQGSGDGGEWASDAATTAEMTSIAADATGTTTTWPQLPDESQPTRLGSGDDAERYTKTSVGSGMKVDATTVVSAADGHGGAMCRGALLPRKTPAGTGGRVRLCQRAHASNPPACAAPVSCSYPPPHPFFSVTPPPFIDHNFPSRRACRASLSRRQCC